MLSGFFRSVPVLLAVVFLMYGCGGESAVRPVTYEWRKPEPLVFPDPVPAQGLTRTTRDKVLSIVQAQIGRPYRWGGRSPDSGFDCSGLVQYSHSVAGIEVPRKSSAQLNRARKVALDDLQPGDLLFFRIRRNASHVGVYIGDGLFVHAPSRGKKVQKQRLQKSYWQSRLYAAGNFYRDSDGYSERFDGR